MVRPRRLIWIALLLVSVASVSARGPADSFRWDVKTATDPRAQQIHRHVDASVTELCALQRPDRVSGYTPRLAPIEQTIYRVKALFLFYRLEEDGDVHVVLQDPNDESQTLVAEIPSPSDMFGSSPFTREITRLREDFDRDWTPNSSRRNGRQILVLATGIGFFDKRHGAIGEAPNGIELHPLLDLQVIRE